MKTDRRRYADPCGIARALDVVGERWALLVIRELMLGPRRFGQLREGLPDTSPNVLAQRLRELEQDGIVRRYTLEPPASLAVYELTDRGLALEPVLLELGRWGSGTARATGRELSPVSMMLALKTMFDPATDARVTYGLQVGDEQFRIAIADHRITIRRSRPDDADARIATDITTLRMVVFLGTGIRAAEEAGALTITGDRRAAARFPKFFRRPDPADPR
jgi:DNA-binding HxlR family transcriptional regulator